MQVNGVGLRGNNVQIEGVDDNQYSTALTVLIPRSKHWKPSTSARATTKRSWGAGGAVTNVFLKSGSNNLHGAPLLVPQRQRLGRQRHLSAEETGNDLQLLRREFRWTDPPEPTFFFGDFLQIKDRRGVTASSFPCRRRRSAPAISAASCRAWSYTIRPLEVGIRVLDASRSLTIEFLTVRISPIAQKILALAPLPNLGSDIINNYASSTSRIKDSNSFDIKVDQPTDR